MTHFCTLNCYCRQPRMSEEMAEKARFAERFFRPLPPEPPDMEPDPDYGLLDEGTEEE